MDFVSNIWSKTGLKKEDSTSDSVDQQSNEVTDPTAADANTTTTPAAEPETRDGAAHGTVGFMSNFIKSTFKSDSNSDRKTSVTSDAGRDGESMSPKGFVSNIFKNPFKSESRKGSTSSVGGEDAAAAANVITDESGGEAASAGGADNSATQKAIDSAKNFGNFLSSVANKAGQTVTSTATKLKHTVEESLLSDFTKEQQEFMKEHGGNLEAADAPWIGCENEEEVKAEIIGLSQDKRNFVRNPPAGVEFDFDLKSCLPVALSILKEDPNLSKMRYDIVPKLVNEETFWRNYFYRVSLLKQSTQANLMKKASGAAGMKGWGSESSSEAEGPDEISPSSENAEFISDTFQASAADASPVQRSDTIQSTTSSGVRRGDSIRANDEKRWEDEITKDLQEFEMVGGSGSEVCDEDLEKDLAAL